MRTGLLFLLGVVDLSWALREHESMCDFYTHTILGSNTESNQGLLMQLLTNTAIIGNYTSPNVGISVPGFVAPGEFMGQSVSLLPYFTGALNSTNIHGKPGAKFFLDDGGPEPLMQNKSSNGNTGSAQFNLVSHVQQYFGAILGCSKQGGSTFPAYGGKSSMWEVHRFMDLGYAENSYLIQQFVLSAASLGFSKIDAAKFNSALDFLFNFRGSPPITLIPSEAGEQLQTVCIAPDCPLFPISDLSAYPDVGVAPAPAVVNQTLVGNLTVKATETQTPTPTAEVGYGCVLFPRGIADDAGASACASGTTAVVSLTASGTQSGSIASTATSISGAKSMLEFSPEWFEALAVLGTALLGSCWWT